MKIPLIASRLQRYGGRALRAGEEFMASKADAAVLTAARLAVYKTRDGAAKPARRARARQRVAHSTPMDVPSPPVESAGDDLAALRAAYAALAGKPARERWKADRLRREIEALRSADGGATWEGEGQ